jgi:sporulation protein YlmC with PRC-barrel domain
MKASALKGIPVLAIRDGLRVGVVEDVLVDTAARTLGALALGAAGQRRVVAFAAVKGVGTDAITIESAQDAPEAAPDLPLAQLPALSALAKLEVIDTSGTRQGTLADLEIDPADGRILEVLVHRGGVLGMGGSTQAVPVSAVRSLGPQVVMVEPPPADSPSS